MSSYDTIKIIPCSPNLERSYPAHIHSHQSTLIWTTGHCVVWTNINDLSNCDYYADNQNKLTIAKFAPNGNLVAQGDVSGLLKVWWIDNPNHITKLEAPCQNGPIRDISWSPQGDKVLAVGAGQVNGKVFNIDIGNQAGELTGHSKEVLACSFKPTRPFKIVTGGEDNQVNFYEGLPFRYKGHHFAHSKFINGIKYSPDGRYFVSVGGDRKVILWEGTTFELLQEIQSEQGHTGSINCVEWIDQDHFVTGGNDKKILTWSFEGVIDSFDVGEGVENCVLGIHKMDDGTLACILLDGTILLKQQDHIRRVFNNKHAPLCMAFWKNDEQTFLISSDQTGAVVGRTNYSETAAPLYQQNAYICQLAINDEGIIASCDANRHIYFYQFGDVSSIELQTDALDICWGDDILYAILPDQICTVKNFNQVEFYQLPFKAVKIAYSSGIIWAASTIMKIFFTQDFIEWGELPLRNGGQISTMSISPDCQYMASGDSTKKISLWNIITKEIIPNQWTYHTAAITKLCWTQDSQHLISSSVDGSVYVWRLGQMLPQVQLRHLHTFNIKTMVLGNQNDDTVEVITSGGEGLIKIISLNLS